MAKISKRVNVRANQSLEKYLQEIGEMELLDPEEEIRLAKKIRVGDKRALEKLTKANLRFVVSAISLIRTLQQARFFRWCMVF